MKAAFLGFAVLFVAAVELTATWTKTAQSSPAEESKPVPYALSFPSSRSTPNSIVNQYTRDNRFSLSECLVRFTASPNSRLSSASGGHASVTPCPTISCTTSGSGV